MDSDNSSGSSSNLEIEGSNPVEVESKAHLRKLLELLRNLFDQWLKCNGHDRGLGLINNGGLVEVLVASILFRTEDLCWVFFKGDPSEWTSSIVKEDLVSDLVHACAIETSKLIVQDVGDDYFGIVVGVFCDRETEVHLAVCLRYVDKAGKVMERFLGMVHVGKITALSLKSALDSLLREHSLSLSKVRGQSYDGVSRMNVKSALNGLMTLVMEETKSAYYVHCFAYHLQSTLLAVAGTVDDGIFFFGVLEDLANLVNSTSNQKEIAQETATQKFIEVFRFKELEHRNAVNQEFHLASPDLGCWGFEQFNSLLQVVNLFPTILDVLDIIEDKSPSYEFQYRARDIMFRATSFKFVFVAHLMTSIIRYTNGLSLALQRKDILNALSLVPVVKGQLHRMRDSGWETLMIEVSAFCAKNVEVEVCDMDAFYGPSGKRFRDEQVTNLHHYQVDVFFRVIDLQLEELTFRFSEVSNELLTCMACLSPADCFSCFDKQKLIRLAQFYPDEFPSGEMLSFGVQLDNYIIDMRRDNRFSNLKDLNELSVKLVETKKHMVWSQVYLLIKLVLLLPVVTANDERLSSSMISVRHQVESCISDQLLSDSLITLVERDTFSQVLDDDVLSI